MVLSIAGALAGATAVVLAAHAARRWRGLTAEVRSMRSELRRIARSIESGPAGSRAEDVIDRESAAGPADRAGPIAEHDAARTRGSRTVH